MLKSIGARVGRMDGPSIVIAMLALGLALGGTALAAKQITGKQVKNNSLTGKDVKDGSLNAADVNLSGSPDLGFKKVVMRQGPDVNVPASGFTSAEASCDSGEQATGGGVYNESNVSTINMTSSYPTPNPVTRPATGNGQTPTGWRVYVSNQTAATGHVVNAYVLCAS